MAVTPKHHRSSHPDPLQRSTQTPNAIFVGDRFWLKEKYWTESHINYFATNLRTSFFGLSRIYPPISSVRKSAPKVLERWTLTDRTGHCYGWAICEEMPSAFKKKNFYVGGLSSLDLGLALECVSKLLSFEKSQPLVHLFSDSSELLSGLETKRLGVIKFHWIPNPSFWSADAAETPFLKQSYLEM